MSLSERGGIEILKGTPTGKNAVPVAYPENQARDRDEFVKLTPL